LVEERFDLLVNAISFCSALDKRRGCTSIFRKERGLAIDFGLSVFGQSADQFLGLLLSNLVRNIFTRGKGLQTYALFDFGEYRFPELVKFALFGKGV
jgi:hypothetical protein